MPLSFLRIPRPDFDVANSIIQRLIMGESWTGKFPMKNKLGERFVAVTTNTPFCDDDGSLVGIMRHQGLVFLFNVNNTSSVSSSESTSSSHINKVDMETDCLDYEILWEDLTIREQIGQGEKKRRGVVIILGLSGLSVIPAEELNNASKQVFNDHIAKKHTEPPVAIASAPVTRNQQKQQAEKASVSGQKGKHSEQQLLQSSTRGRGRGTSKGPGRK
ncbi:hypothetical protein IFM89_031079 [Coptis chinensis]|uniref:Uncharacterized protein n=1 Tax=Coptis chinensis TaxID=261450 RepID=A0A835I101_9MAGN|nr:hypothetical protein IFM89_031079 [Coptis chinensis]